MPSTMSTYLDKELADILRSTQIRDVTILADGVANIESIFNLEERERRMIKEYFAKRSIDVWKTMAEKDRTIFIDVLRIYCDRFKSFTSTKEDMTLQEIRKLNAEFPLCVYHMLQLCSILQCLTEYNFMFPVAVIAGLDITEIRESIPRERMCAETFMALGIVTVPADHPNVFGSMCMSEAVFEKPFIQLFYSSVGILIAFMGINIQKEISKEFAVEFVTNIRRAIFYNPATKAQGRLPDSKIVDDLTS